MAPSSLGKYQQKRNFSKTSEPAGSTGDGEGNRFVIHKHSATADHYDLRLEIDGVLKSWAVPKGPSLNPADKRYAAETEDHTVADRHEALRARAQRVDDADRLVPEPHRAGHAHPVAARQVQIGVAHEGRADEIGRG